jgi:hypothetical protein
VECHIRPLSFKQNDGEAQERGSVGMMLSILELLFKQLHRIEDARPPDLILAIALDHYSRLAGTSSGVNQHSATRGPEGVVVGHGVSC